MNTQVIMSLHVHVSLNDEAVGGCEWEPVSRGGKEEGQRGQQVQEVHGEEEGVLSVIHSKFLQELTSSHHRTRLWQKSQVRQFSDCWSADFGPRLPPNQQYNKQKIDALASDRGTYWLTAFVMRLRALWRKQAWQRSKRLRCCEV